MMAVYRSYFSLVFEPLKNLFTSLLKKPLKNFSRNIIHSPSVCSRKFPCNHTTLEYWGPTSRSGCSDFSDLKQICLNRCDTLNFCIINPVCNFIFTHVEQFYPLLLRQRYYFRHFFKLAVKNFSYSWVRNQNIRRVAKGQTFHVVSLIKTPTFLVYNYQWSCRYQPWPKRIHSI